MYNNVMSALTQNKVHILGVLGSEPKITTGIKLVASFSLATNEYWTDSTTGEKKTSTQWHRIVTFEERFINALKNAKVGSNIYIEGMLKYRSIGEGSEKKTLAEIVVGKFNSLILLGKNTSDSDSHKQDEINDDEDSIPF